MATHRKLTNAARFAILRKLAAFQGPTEIAAAIAAEFGFEIRPQSIEHYDPHKNEMLAKTWADYFYEQRRRYLKEHDAEPMESRRYRQNERRKLYENARSPKLKAALLNDAALESLAWEKLAMANGVGKRSIGQNLADRYASDPHMKHVLEMTREQRREYLDELLDRRGLVLCHKHDLSPKKLGKGTTAKSSRVQTQTDR